MKNLFGNTGSSQSPIIIHNGSPPSKKSPVSSPATPPSLTTKISKDDLFGEPSSDSDGKIIVSSDIRKDINQLLTPAQYADLTDLQKSRDVWIPGYRERKPRSSTQVAPWSARRVSLTSVAELGVEFFYRHLSRPRGYIFTPQANPKSLLDSAWIPRLITPAQVTAIYDQKPWNVTRRPIAPISFPLTGWFNELADIYLEYEDRHRQALWEAIHFLYISRELRKEYPELAQFCQQRKQRRSRSGPRWKTILRVILQGMIEGHCDLDILLDPYFLHFPVYAEVRPWYPGLDCKQKNIPNLITALSLLDSAEPWRNQYRSSIADHPGSSLARLSSKFFPKQQSGSDNTS